jgi:uncharacterized protein YhbP (UPF0306 family)
MAQIDEPLFDGNGGDVPDNQPPDLSDRIRDLLASQPYAVLCTQGEGQPYGSVVAFAFSDDLRYAVFATPVATRKYRLLTECDHVALVIDDRATQSENLTEIQAVTVTGRAHEVGDEDEVDRWATLLVNRHPLLKSFVAARSCAVFRVDTVRFFHVSRFQEVNQWRPTAS